MNSEIVGDRAFMSMPMEGWFNEQESSEQPSSSSGAASPRRHDLLDTYQRSFRSVDNGTIVSDLAYSKPGTSYLKLEDLDLVSWASSNQAQRQSYQMNMGSLLAAEMVQGAHIPSESGLAPPVSHAMQQQQPDYSRPSSSSSSLRSISVGSPECSSFLRNMGGCATSSNQQLPDVIDPSQNLTQLVVPTPTATSATYSRFRDASASQLPSPRNDDVAIMRAMLVVLSNPLSQAQPPVPAAEQIIHPSTPSPQAQAAGVGRAGAFKPYGFGPHFRRFKPAGSSSANSMIRRIHSMLKTVDGLRAEEKAAAAAHASTKGPSSNQLHHMISERKRREKLNESFQALRALLPSGTKRDKASVLATAKDYLANLKVQISDLEEKNRNLESKMEVDDHVEEFSTALMGRPTIQITQTSQGKTEMPQMNLNLTMRVDCDVLDVVLGILECVKTMRVLSLVSIDVDHIASKQIVKARFTLHVSEGADLDEGVFKEAVATAVDKVVSRRT